MDQAFQAACKNALQAESEADMYALFAPLLLCG